MSAKVRYRRRQQAERTIRVRIVREPIAADLPLPRRATLASAGMDLIAALPDDAPITLEPGARAQISTGLRIAVPPGYEAQIRPRSGLAAQHGIGLVNAPGTIDADYRGVVQVLLINHGSEPVMIQRGERIAQMVVQAVPRIRWVETDTLPATARGEGGFGSTGRKTEQ